MEGSWLQLEVVNNVGIKKHGSKSGGRLGVFGHLKPGLKYLPSPSREVWYKTSGCPRMLAVRHADPSPSCLSFLR